MMLKYLIVLLLFCASVTSQITKYGAASNPGLKLLYNGEPKLGSRITLSTHYMVQPLPTHGQFVWGVGRWLNWTVCSRGPTFYVPPFWTTNDPVTIYIPVDPSLIGKSVIVQWVGTLDEKGQKQNPKNCDELETSIGIRIEIQA